MNTAATVQATIYHRAMRYSVTVTLTSSTTGHAVIGGRTRSVTLKMATRGKNKGTLSWQCDTNE